MSLMRILARTAAALVVATAVASPAAAASPVNASFFGKVAIHGYDPVGYFTAGKPTLGDKQFTVEWRGASWRFASAENRDLFKQDSAKYAPQYGGFCAWAVSNGETADIDPAAWKIVDGKLYLNYSLDIQRKWEADMKASIVRADANWPKLSR